MNPPLSQRHSAPAGDRNQAIMDHDQMAPDVHAPHQSGHLPVTQVMYFYYTSIGLNPPMTSIKNWQCHQIMAFYIYINHCHRVQADYLPHGPWMVPDRLTCWVFEDVMEVHQEHLINLLWPSPTDALGPNIMPAVTLSLLMASAPLWTDTEGPLTAFQLISGPSSSLTHDNLVSKPQGEDTQRKWFPLELTNGFFFFLLLLLEQVSFILYLSAGDTVYSSHFFMYLPVRAVSQVLTRSECTRE